MADVEDEAAALMGYRFWVVMGALGFNGDGLGMESISRTPLRFAATSCSSEG